MRGPILLLLCWLGSLQVCRATGGAFEYTPGCSKAYQCFLSLHMAEGRAAIAREMAANPGNAMTAYIADYDDCIQLLLSCDKAAYEAQAGHMDERLEAIERGDHNSPWYRFCKSGIYLHWALINMRMGNLYHEAIYFRKSVVLLRENRERFPAFEYNAIFSGLQEAVAGSLPANYKWLASLFGISGSVKKGTAQLTAFVAAHNAAQPLYAETVLYELFTRFYLSADQQAVWDYLSGPSFSVKDNLVNAFAKVNIALDYHKADAAIQVLHIAAATPGYEQYGVLDYQMGLALLTRCDTGCTWYFGQYLKKNKSDIFIKDAWQKMAFAWYVAGDMKKAEYCRTQVAQRGDTRLDADKQAMHFAGNGAWPNRGLLQSRLLLDGGYHQRALAILSATDVKTLTAPGDKAEYYFRLGRVYEEAGSADKALAYYQAAIAAGKGRHEQFAARAALHRGRIYEQAGSTEQAKNSYNECLDMPSHDFQNSIDHQAKAGLNRVEGK